MKFLFPAIISLTSSTKEDHPAYHLLQKDPVLNNKKENEYNELSYTLEKDYKKDDMKEDKESIQLLQNQELLEEKNQQQVHALVQQYQDNKQSSLDLPKGLPPFYASDQDVVNNYNRRVTHDHSLPQYPGSINTNNAPSGKNLYGPRTESEQEKLHVQAMHSAAKFPHLLSDGKRMTKDDVGQVLDINPTSESVYKIHKVPNPLLNIPTDECKCDHGHPIKNKEECHSESYDHAGLVIQENLCETCQYGYYLQGYQCIKNPVCENGVGVPGEHKDGQDLCQYCNMGYMLRNGSCVASCKCTGGIAVPDHHCITPGAEQCQKCVSDDQIVHPKSGVCDYRCACDNGIPGNMCLQAGEQDCDYCLHGYTLDNEHRRCFQNCRCDHGIPFPDNRMGTKCPHPNVQACLYCYDYAEKVLKTDDCQPHCRCDNGIPQPIGQCQKDIDCQQCLQCNEGYKLNCVAKRLSNGKMLHNCVCEPAQCFCNHGTAIKTWRFGDATYNYLGIYCIPGTEMCSDCDTGYSLNIKTKLCERDCFCDLKRGVAAKGVFCLKPGSHKCQYCLEGFTLDDDFRCKPACHCENGVAQIGDICLDRVNDDTGISHGKHRCYSCFHDYELDSNKHCVLRDDANTLRCQNGIGAVHPDEHGYYACTNCQFGYKLENGRCLGYCSCDHGVPAVGKACKVSGQNICASCYEGFALTTEIDNHPECAPKCICSNGTAADEGCGDVLGKCVSCDADFELHDDLCVSETCLDDLTWSDENNLICTDYNFSDCMTGWDEDRKLQLRKDCPRTCRECGVAHVKRYTAIGNVNEDSFKEAWGVLFTKYFKKIN